MNTLVLNHQPLRTIKLSGKMAKMFGHVHRLAVSSVAEGIRALCIMKPGLERYLMNAKDNGLVFAVHVGKENINEEQLTAFVDPKDEIRISPVVMGSKNAGIMQIIVGAVLIVVGVVISGMTFGLAAPIGGALVGMGISMIVGGVIQLLSPPPKGQKSKDKADDEESYIFNGVVNTQSQGNNVPVLYGELFVGSAVVSAGISTSDNYVVSNPTGTGGGSVRGGGGSRGDVIARFSNAAE